jgi:tetratricopeptide (TPR) repeat protein
MNRTRFTIITRLALVVAVAAGCAPGWRERRAKRQNAPKAVSQYVTAVRAYEQGNDQRAIESLERATKADPDLTMARGMLGDLYRSKGEYGKAVPQYEAMTRLDPYTPANHYKLGIAYQFLRRLEDAAASYLRALKLDPKDAKTNMNLGLVYLALGQVEDAVRYTEKATLLDPESPAAFSNLGVVLEAAGEYARAEAAYRRSLDLDPLQQQTLLNLGLNLIQQNKGADAVSIMERVLKNDDSPLTHKRYGDALARAGRYEEAVKQYQLAVERDPRFYQALNEIGWVRIAEYRKGLELDDSKRKSAIEHWQRSLKIRPDQPRIQTAIADWGEKMLFGK